MKTSKAYDVDVTNLKVTVASLFPFEEKVELLLKMIIKDYCQRFKRKLKRPNEKISIALVTDSGNMMDGEMSRTGLACDSLHGIYVQVQNPYMNDQMAPNEYSDHLFIENMCHEFVHVCQYLTLHDGCPIDIPHDNDDLTEKYFFDVSEIEARILEAFYAQAYGTIAFPVEVHLNGESI